MLKKNQMIFGAYFSTDKLFKSYHAIKCINDIHVTLKDQIEHFFTYYKDLDASGMLPADTGFKLFCILFLVL
jgi:inorganic pyrophosphatase